MDAKTRKDWLDSTPADMHWLARKRATGRTTRMLQAALQAHTEGYDVYVVTSPGMVSHFKHFYKDDPGIKVVAAPSNIDSTGNFDWRTCSLRVAHPSCRVFVDHHCIERAFGAMLKEWHRYDLQEPA
jgi:hypothetical protein